MNFQVSVCADPINDLDIQDDSYIPSLISEGKFSNEDLTIFSGSRCNSNSDLTDFEEKIWIHVNHENSFGDYQQHKSDEKNHFTLFYNKDMFIIDPGYRVAYDKNWWRTLKWCRSTYAHNTIVINPEIEDEFNYIQNDFSTVTGSTYPGNESLIIKSPISQPAYQDYTNSADIPDPCQKKFFIANSNDTHLKTVTDIDDASCIINRNFYMFDDDSVIIYDRVESEDGTVNSFRNQLHFNHESQITFLTEDLSTFSQELNGSYLHGNMNSINESHLFYDSSDTGQWPVPRVGISYGLPTGWNGGSDTDDGHSRLRVESVIDLEFEDYLTILIPSFENVNPIFFSSHSNDSYKVKFNNENTRNNSGEIISYTGLSYNEGVTSFDFEDEQINCNGDFFLFTSFVPETHPEIIYPDPDGSFILHNGDFLNFNDINVFQTDQNAEEIMVNWAENDELFITIKTEFNDYPKYKILRNGVLPENLFSKTEFGSYHPETEPEERGTIENNIQNLAYDDDYFYVNYSIGELVSENLFSDELVVYQGSYSDITVPELLTLGTGEFIMSGAWLIPQNCELKILEGANLELNSDFDLTVDGQLTAIGTEEQKIILRKHSTSNWEQISINTKGSAYLVFCELSNSDFPIINMGYVEIRNSQITDCKRGIFLDNPSGYIVENSTITECGFYGILLRNTHLPIYRSTLRNNLISENDYGLWFYNASSIVENDTIYANNSVGIYCNRGSNPIIIRSSISGTYNNSIDNPEIKISDSSYPVIDRNRNDIIFDNGYSIYNMDAVPRDYRSSENWWGTTNELSIYNSFYPTTWLTGFVPFATTPNVDYEPPFDPESLYREGLAAVISGDTELAKTMYIQSIEEDPNDIDAILSASRLINCSETSEEYFETQEYYEELLELLPEGELAKTVKLNKLFSTRKQGNHQEALNGYETLAETEQTFLDSIFTQLDIIYTYLEANSDGDRSSHVRFKNAKNELRSYNEAKEKESGLWELLNNNTENAGIYSPGTSKNYFK